MATIKLLLDTAALSASSEFQSMCKSHASSHPALILVVLADARGCIVYAQILIAAAGDGNA